MPVQGCTLPLPLPLPYNINKDISLSNGDLSYQKARYIVLLFYYISLIMSHIARVGPMMAYNVETRRFIQHKNFVVSTIFYVTISPCTLFHSCPAIQASDFSMVSR